MGPSSIYTLKIFKKIYDIFIKKKYDIKSNYEYNADQASEIIFNKLNDDNPSMIARFGANELATCVNYLGVKNPQRNIIGYIKGATLPWWWNRNHIQDNMYNGAGFFPPTLEKIEQFCELMLQDIPQVDILGSWLAQEKYFISEEITPLVRIIFLEPFWSKNPWTRILEGKKVLVIHPFATLIEKQYTNNRVNLFSNPDILPDFELSTIQAVQSIAGEDCGFNDWFEALEFMKNKINETDYDFCLIGAGAYGFPLAAHVKRSGKKAIHMGGALQLLFGIIGKRWEDPNYGVKEWGIPKGFYSILVNQYWVRPSSNDKPKNAKKVEDACYW